MRFDHDFGRRSLANGGETEHNQRASIRARYRALAVSSPGQEQNLTPKEVADYIASLLEGLRELAQDAQLSFLAYLIGIALEEAQAEKARRD
jgi:hypothetical protein